MSASSAPEQARGKTVDRRADIWAFGAVLFEMLTGRRAFGGDDLSTTIASVMMKEPDWSALPASTPAGLRRLLTRCLKKDVKARLQAIGDARLQIEELQSGAPEELFMAAASGAASQPVIAARRWIVALASVALLIAAVSVIATWALMRTPLAKLQPMRFTIVPSVAQPLAISGIDRDLALSPDGTHFVYVSNGGQLMLRAIDQLDPTPLSGLTGARTPFFSPDGRWIGFFTGGATGELKKIPITGGPPLSLCRYQGSPGGASWGPDDTIVFATNDQRSGLFRVSAAGGVPTVLTTPDAAQGERNHLFPSVLPDGRAVLFTIFSAGSIDTAQVAILDFSTGQRTTLIRGGSQAEYVGTGHLVYAVAGTLRAVRVDPVTRKVLSDPVPVLDADPDAWNRGGGVQRLAPGRAGVCPGRRFGARDSVAGVGEPAGWRSKSGIRRWTSGSGISPARR